MKRYGVLGVSLFFAGVAVYLASLSLGVVSLPKTSTEPDIGVWLIEKRCR